MDRLERDSPDKRGGRRPRSTFPPLSFNAWLRHDAISALLDRSDDVERVLEVGAGQGAMGARLARRYSYVGLEPDPASFGVARDRIERIPGALIMQGDVSCLGAEQGFDLICAFEVLEHIEDDASALRQWRERLRPKGWLLFSVPAHERRFGPADELVGHFRRYERGSLDDLLARAGFTAVSIITYGFPLGFVLEAVRNKTARRRLASGSHAERTAASGRWLQPPESLGRLTQFITAPFRLMQRPFARTERGTGFVVLARRGEDR